MGADGVHIGQTDMPLPIARKLLPPGTIIGKTCNTAEHIRVAIEEGADYVGLGPVWGTKTKDVKSPVVGPRGIGELLQVLDGTDVKAVAIGIYTSDYSAASLAQSFFLAGINSTNALHCLWGSVSPTGRQLDGLAVVSDIMASQDPFAASKRLSNIIRAFYRSSARTFSNLTTSTFPYTPENLKTSVGSILNSVRQHGPLVHQVRVPLPSDLWRRSSCQWQSSFGMTVRHGLILALADYE